jgi:hypothetical protein
MRPPCFNPLALPEADDARRASTGQWPFTMGVVASLHDCNPPNHLALHGIAPQCTAMHGIARHCTALHATTATTATTSGRGKKGHGSKSLVFGPRPSVNLAVEVEFLPQASRPT